MARFHRLRIADITRETADCVSLVFDIPAAIRSEFNYQQGQYLTLKLIVNGEEIRRSYSVCSSPVADSELRIAIKKVKDGRGSTYLNDVARVGDELEVMTPMGNFHSPMLAAHTKQYYLFAGGSGITPMLSIIKTVLHSEPNSKLTLFYGNRDTNSIIFKNQLEQLLAANANRLAVIHILEQGAADALCTGIMSPEKVQELITKYGSLSGDNEFFVCGPTPMMQNVQQVLEAGKVEAKRIHIEYFTAALETPKTPVAASSSDTSKVTVIMDGAETIFDVSATGDAILDLALDAGLDVPYACKGAVCCTCRAKVLEGKMTMDNNFALTDDEVRQGYVLTCQAHPATPVVVVSYDEL
ncbi:MAG: 2Fe-2S iron-sulfur cluster-binding protein [Bacteroidia bacterium]